MQSLNRATVEERLFQIARKHVPAEFIASKPLPEPPVADLVPTCGHDVLGPRPAFYAEFLCEPRDKLLQTASMHVQEGVVENEYLCNETNVLDRLFKVSVLPPHPRVPPCRDMSLRVPSLFPLFLTSLLADVGVLSQSGGGPVAGMLLGVRRRSAMSPLVASLYRDYRRGQDALPGVAEAVRRALCDGARLLSASSRRRSATAGRRQGLWRAMHSWRVCQGCQKIELERVC